MGMGSSISKLLLAAIVAASSSAASHEPIVVEEGVFVNEDGIPAGWYSISPEDDAFTKAAVFDCLTFDQPVHLASYVWYEDGSPVLSDDPNGPEEYTIPLWDGCLVLAGYYFGIEYDKATGEAGWNQYEDEAGPMGRVRLEFVAPLGELPASETAAPVSDRLLYEDENLAVTYSDFYVEQVGSSSYLKTELLFKNKTDRILIVTCNSVIINGCAVDISKFVEVPANTTFLNSWTNGAEMYLKYGIESIETFSMVMSYRDAGTYVSGKSIQTNQINVK